MPYNSGAYAAALFPTLGRELHQLDSTDVVSTRNKYVMAAISWAPIKHVSDFKHMGCESWTRIMTSEPTKGRVNVL